MVRVRVGVRVVGLGLGSGLRLGLGLGIGHPSFKSPHTLPHPSHPYRWVDEMEDDWEWEVLKWPQGWFEGADSPPPDSAGPSPPAVLAVAAHPYSHRAHPYYTHTHTHHSQPAARP